MAVVGLALCAFAGRIGIIEGGKLGAIVIGVGAVLFAADLFIE